jgi:hypothetical protein
VTRGVERGDQVIRSIKFVLLQRHDARGGCRIVRCRTPAMELEDGVGFMTAMTTQMASTSERSGTRLLSETVTNVPGVSSSGDRPRQHGLDFPSSGVITLWEPPAPINFS